MTEFNEGLLKKFFVGAGCGVWGVGCGVLPIFRWSIT